jgi:hypothetical protein
MKHQFLFKKYAVMFCFTHSPVPSKPVSINWKWATDNGYTKVPEIDGSVGTDDDLSKAYFPEYKLPDFIKQYLFYELLFADENLPVVVPTNPFIREDGIRITTPIPYHEYEQVVAAKKGSCFDFRIHTANVLDLFSFRKFLKNPTKTFAGSTLCRCWRAVFAADGRRLPVFVRVGRRR